MTFERENFNQTRIKTSQDLYKTIQWCYQNPQSDNVTIRQSIKVFSMDPSEIYSIIFVAFFITIIRYCVERFLFTKFVNWLELTGSNKKRFSESLWKCIFYTSTWSYCLYLIKYRYDYFDQPYLIWDDWSVNLIIPLDIKFIYIIECGFYFHSIYATLYMDHRRKDFYIMIVHHVLTIMLIFFSYGMRYHKIGLLVLFLHDIADIWLEMTKLTRYLNARKSSSQGSGWERLSYVGFSIFALSWFIFRLYWYPLKVLYTTGVTCVYRFPNKNLHFYIPFNILLWILFGLNIYWFILILQILCKTLAGLESKSGDVREDDDDDDDEEQISSSSTMNNLNKKKK